MYSTPTSRRASLHAEVERLGAQYLAMGSLSASDCDTFRTAIKKLQSMYADHIRVEDTVIFPLAARVLSQEEKTVIARAGISP